MPAGADWAGKPETNPAGRTGAAQQLQSAPGIAIRRRGARNPIVRHHDEWLFHPGPGSTWPGDIPAGVRPRGHAFAVLCSDHDPLTLPRHAAVRSPPALMAN